MQHGTIFCASASRALSGPRSRPFAAQRQHVSQPRERSEDVGSVTDPELSKRFYLDLGFTRSWSNEEIAKLQIDTFRFLLKKSYVADHAGNFMMS